THAPRATNSRPSANPNPRDPPVISAVLPRRSYHRAYCLIARAARYNPAPVNARLNNEPLSLFIRPRPDPPIIGVVQVIFTLSVDNPQSTSGCETELNVLSKARRRPQKGNKYAKTNCLTCYVTRAIGIDHVI